MLKRFEYDQNTYTRYKLNDYFEFPLEINLKKWVNFSSHDDDLLGNHEISKYQYTLKGVTVHSGSAEFGHYYSYIKIEGKWVLFNDTKVSEFEPTLENINREWFGGNGTGISSSFSSSNKSAYMLFYEKIGSLDIESVESSYIPFSEIDPITRDLIQDENEEFIRKKIYSDSMSIGFLNELIGKFDNEEGINHLLSLILNDAQDNIANSEFFVFLSHLNHIVLEKLANRSPLLANLSQNVVSKGKHYIIDEKDEGKQSEMTPKEIADYMNLNQNDNDYGNYNYDYDVKHDGVDFELSNEAKNSNRSADNLESPTGETLQYVYQGAGFDSFEEEKESLGNNQQEIINQNMLEENSKEEDFNNNEFL